ncbi:hypothetical protein SAMN05216600_11912 [Pseudomonas cuatrocienegasensis]|uniref:Uncharacterized protein n=1 Tax=Pseudomonas cuatrocienegasensis TaxID=543360 RepID=A0ABY1BNC3_9PSED|nr:hypothetical protein SAMN05216600_11912 [Pseudomonas cuatrocienegasensis]
MLSLFADQKLDSLDAPLAVLNKHVDFGLMAEKIDRWGPRPSRAQRRTSLRVYWSRSSCTTCPTSGWSSNYSIA